MDQNDLILTEWKELERTLAGCVMAGGQTRLAALRGKWRPELAQDVIDFWAYACSIAIMDDESFLDRCLEWIWKYQYIDQLLQWSRLETDAQYYHPELFGSAQVATWALDGIKKLRYLQGSLDFLQELADQQSVY
jgi:hypothetical protein